MGNENYPRKIKPAIKAILDKYYKEEKRMEIIEGGKANMRQAKDLSPENMALAIAYVEIEKKMNGAKRLATDKKNAAYAMETIGLMEAMNIIKELLDVATLGDIDFDDVAKMRMRI